MSVPVQVAFARTPAALMRCFLALIISAVFLFSAVPAALGAKVSARTGEISLPTYGWAAVKHPYFRGTDGKNVYPYPMIDFLSRDKTNRTFRTVILENEFLRITFLPELGGKIHEVIEKTTRQPMFYVNHVVKPGLIAECGAWTSGGVEWNTGPQGHTVSCMQPVDVLILPADKDGSRSVAIGETERIYGTKWTVVVTLRPGRSFIEERIRIYNPTETIRPYYFWNCTAMPNTPGFRFIYPMTLGCDHAGEKFFKWPIDNGKDLTRGTNYQDASSIFAWRCDQDFFGSYMDDLDRGVVSYANHHQLPGKKAWTWGQGGFGKMHQMDLTDDDGPYNEVQTGPLLTQAQVGRLDPCEAVEWKEWWYPVHGIDGFTFANKDLAANAAIAKGTFLLKLIGTGSWPRATVMVNQHEFFEAKTCDLEPGSPVELQIRIREPESAFTVSVLDKNAALLARWSMPVDLPSRKPPAKKQPPVSAFEQVEAGWQDFLFARFSDADQKFRTALAKDPKCRDARVGLAYLELDRNPEKAAEEARAAVEVDPGHGVAHYVLAVAELRLGHSDDALDSAWKSLLDPVTDVAGRALIAKIAFRKGCPDLAIRAFDQFGAWENDPLCLNRLALAQLKRGAWNTAVALAKRSLEIDPLDPCAQKIAASSVNRRAVAALDPQAADLLNVVEENTPADRWPDWPYRWEMIEPLQMIVDQNQKDGKARLRLGHLLFHLGRHAEGRELWKRAAELGAEPKIAYRALGMAAKTLDNDPNSARLWLEKANRSDPKDSIVARDLANVLFAMEDKTNSDAAKRELATEACNRLKGAFEEGKCRSDFVALLGRAQNRLGDFAETARMLDTVRVTIWEGSQEVHDLFVQSHMALGEQHINAGRASDALVEFNRALEYPANLATGKLENAREAHIHLARGNALSALGRKDEAAAAWKLAASEPEGSDPKIKEAREKAKAALEAL